MADLVEIAERLASKGVVVVLEIKVWSGVIPAREEWGGSGIGVLHSGVLSGIKAAKSKILANLCSSSILADHGRFIPNHEIKAWAEEHDNLILAFDKVRSIVIGLRDKMVESARMSAVSLYKENWATATGEPPPPSAILHAAGIASSLVPSADVLRESFSVSRKVRSHSFLFPITDQRASFIGAGERRQEAWLTIDELVAGNVRTYRDQLEHSLPSSNNWTVRSVQRALSASISFIKTDLMPELGLSALAENVRTLLNGKAVESIDDQALALAVRSASDLAKKLSSVSDILGVIG